MSVISIFTCAKTNEAVKRWMGDSWWPLLGAFIRVYKIKNEIGNKEKICLYFQAVSGNFPLKYIL